MPYSEITPTQWLIAGAVTITLIMLALWSIWRNK